MNKEPGHSVDLALCLIARRPTLTICEGFVQEISIDSPQVCPTLETHERGTDYMKKTVLILLGTVLIVAGCSSSSGPAKTVAVKAVNMAFEPKEVSVAQGQPVKVTFSNADSLLHDWSIAKLPAKVGESMGDEHGHEKRDSVHVAADAGKSGTIEFTPTESGTYVITCTVPGHKEAGMTGKLVVS